MVHPFLIVLSDISKCAFTLSHIVIITEAKRTHLIAVTLFRTSGLGERLLLPLQHFVLFVLSLGHFYLLSGRG
jgi:hypothetical protein